MRIKGKCLEYSQEFLAERYNIMNLPNATIADESYFRGCMNMLHALGLAVVKEGNSFKIVPQD